jgi:hypothetical protein
MGTAIAVAPSGEAYVTGTTESPDFPVRDPNQGFQGMGDAFVAQLCSLGDSLLYSTFLGGPSPEAGLAIALDGAARIHVAGFAYEGFPTLFPFQTHQGDADAFVVRIGPPPPVSYWTVPPCRVVDTRGAFGPLGAPPLESGGTRRFPIAGHCGIPPTARAVALNLTVVEPTSGGHLRVDPTSATPTSAVNYPAGVTRAGNGVFALVSGGAMVVRCNQPSGNVHLVVDVSGYFE